ncbi:Zn(2)-C6 fungal-type domain-containing protein [Favolaschia claudopus]|uniref:Zn(2)-C6 fungal-type domain-containing protein n=1 Tax=Favolaschia claudopus TaxID=2862362 RepID=A0AAW0DMK7_9AGAR
MSDSDSNDEHRENGLHRGKKRRLQRACDVCRRKKTACDGSQRSDERCSTCIEFDVDCTYVEAPVKRPPAKGLLELQARLEKSEAMVHQLRAQLAAQNGAGSASSSTMASPATSASSPPDHSTQDPDLPSAAFLVMRMTLKSITAPPSTPHSDDLADIAIANKLASMSMSARSHYYSTSSSAPLFAAALKLNEERTSKEKDSAISISPSAASTSSSSSRPAPYFSRRPQYWAWKSHEGDAPHVPPTFHFPPYTLMRSLINLYFTRQNIYFPLLHRPMFEAAVTSGVHLRDEGFAGTLLLVCAIGARWSDDPGIAASGIRAGWEWFEQVPLGRDCLLGRATLYDLQIYCLAAQFIRGLSLPVNSSTLIGIGSRLAQDLGVHRGLARKEIPTAERELQKRAFWILAYMDRMSSLMLGVAPTVQHFGFDVDLPLAVDDEYWDDPINPFQQPPDKPSYITFFNTLMTLNNLLAFSLQILYPLKKARSAFGITDGWEEQAIADLDSALNGWHERIPEHLTWDPARKDRLFFDQSVFLHSSYYHLQITVHRPFIPMVRRTVPAIPSLAVCTSAARACANIADVQRQVSGDVPAPHLMPAVFTSCLVLLLNALSGKHTGLVPDPSREMSFVHKCMDFIQLCEDRWQAPGMLWDALAELIVAGGLPLPKANPAAAHRQEQERTSSASPSTLASSPPSEGEQHSDSNQYRSWGCDAVFNNLFQNLDNAHSNTNAYTDPTQASHELANLMNNGAMAVWANAPMGWGMDDYLSNYSEMVQGEAMEGQDVGPQSWNESRP